MLPDAQTISEAQTSADVPSLFDPQSLLDPSACAIVLAGTLLATGVRTGWSGCAKAFHAAIALVSARFDEPANRIALARWASAVRKRGVLGADTTVPPDRSLAQAIAALQRTGGVKAMHDTHGEDSAQRMRVAHKASQVFEQAGELAPVFGLVGTLFAVTQIAPGPQADPAAATFAAIATAVLSSLYGVLSAHLIFLPMGDAITRKAIREEEARRNLIDWLAEEIAPILPKQTGPRSTSDTTVQIAPDITALHTAA